MRRSLAELAGRKVLSSVDYENDNTGLPKAQVLEYRLEGKAKLIVRPSGTEPKIKVYLSAVGKTREEADRLHRNDEANRKRAYEGVNNKKRMQSDLDCMRF